MYNVYNSLSGPVQGHQVLQAWEDVALSSALLAL
jgi:hypothetical protein